MEVGGFTHVFKDIETPKTLYANTRTTSGTTLHDMATNADYQVPSGKTFHLIGFLAQNFAGAVTVTIYSSTAADGTTGEVDKIIFSSISANSLQSYPFPALPSWPEDTYVTWKVSSTTLAPHIRFFIGYET